MLLYRLAKLLSPPFCYGCKRLQGALCANCVLTLSPIATSCLWCGYKCSATVCENCLATTHADAVISLTAYAGVAKKLVRAAKFNHQRAAAECMGWLIATRLPLPSVDVVTTVPTLPRHIRRRGYDHTKFIGRIVAAHLNRPAKRLLVRASNTTQVGHTRQKRLEQAKNSVLARNIHMPSSVLLIDDVVTTGATVTACARALKQAGVKSVYVVSFAVQSRPKLEGRSTH